MLAEKSGISFGEDALSTFYSTDSNSDLLAATNSSSSTSSSSSSTSSRAAGGGVMNKLRNWLGFGVSVEEIERAEDRETIDGIMKAFREEDVVELEKFLVPGGSKEKETDGFCWEDEFAAREEKKFVKSVIRKQTPHPKKALAQLPPQVRKSVRFDLDYTPEQDNSRPFTPLFTSTPKQTENDDDDESDDEELPPLRDIDSNTVVLPTTASSTALNNTSSILLANTTALASWNLSRRQTDNAVSMARRTPTHQYRICYDDTDEEEVVEDEPVEVEPTPTRRTFVVERSGSESSGKAASSTLHEQSFDHELDTSTDSSVILGFDRIEDYIRSLEEEIHVANRFAREKDLLRARGAIRHAHILQERLGQMSDAINEMCEKFVGGSEVEDFEANGDHQKDVSAVFEDSCWAGGQLDCDDGSFDAQQL